MDRHFHEACVIEDTSWVAEHPPDLELNIGHDLIARRHKPPAVGHVVIHPEHKDLALPDFDIAGFDARAVHQLDIGSLPVAVPGRPGSPRTRYGPCVRDANTLAGCLFFATVVERPRSVPTYYRRLVSFRYPKQVPRYQRRDGFAGMRLAFMAVRSQLSRQH